MSSNDRVKPQDLHMGAAAPFGQAYTYPFTHEVEKALAPTYWLSVQGRLRPGDSLRLVQVSQRRDRVLKVVETVVRKSDRTGVDLFTLQSYDLDEPDPAPEVDAVPSLPIKPGMQAYVPPVAERKWNIGRDSHLVMHRGEEVAAFPRSEKDKADALVRELQEREAA